MLAESVIKESFSEWSTPIVMAKKANGGYHLCLDFRKLNAFSKKDAYPIPYMSDILKQLKASKYISTIDLSSAINQIPLNMKQLRRFIGLASWYRRLIPVIAVVAETLTRLFRSNEKWHWGEENSKRSTR